MTDIERAIALEDSLVAGARDRIVEDTERIARGLERMAEEVRRFATVEKITADPELVLASIVHETTWGVANLNLDGAMRAVGDYNTLLAAIRIPNPDHTPLGKYEVAP